jgi:hypothetical protein
VLAGCFVRFLSASIYLPGTDSYYYALQTQSLLDNGQLKVPDHVALYYFIAAVARGGPSIEAAFRITLVAIFALYQLGMLLLASRVKEKSQPMAALLWALSSPVIAFHVIEFPNLTLGLATLPIWFWLVMKPVSRWIIWLGLLLTASILVHPVAAALAVLFAVMVTLGTARTDGIQPGKGSLKVLVLVVASGAVLFAVLATTYVGITGRLMSLHPGLPGLLGLASTADVPNEMKLTIVCVWLLLGVLLFSNWRICSGKWKFLVAATMAIPLWPDHVSGLAGVGGRLAASLVLLALPLTIVVWDELIESNRFLSWLHTARAEKFVALSAVIAITILPVRMQAYHELLLSDDYAAYEHVVAALGDAKIPMLIAHRGLDFFYSYRLRRDAFHFDPEPNWNRAEIWRVAARITPEEVAYYSPPTCPWGETAKLIRGTDYVRVREDCWEQLRAQLNPNDDPDLYSEVWDNMENPSQARPAFMRSRYRDLVQRSFPFPAEGEKPSEGF